jgi:hypothetical protein
MTRTRAIRLTIAMLLAALGGCVDDKSLDEGTTSLRVEVTDPGDLGALDRRIPALPQVTVTVTAVDARGEVDTTFNGTVQGYVQFLGSMTPALGSPEPAATVDVVNGVSAPTPFALPRALGQTVLWLEDAARVDATYAAGTSPFLWLRDPYISDIQTPRDENALDALQSSPLELKQVSVNASRYGARGRLIVTSTYAQGYTVSDVECQDEAGTPPCVAGDYDHMLVYTYGRPTALGGRAIQVGDSVARFGGGVQEFNGLTELGFPQSRLTDEPTDPARVPAPRLVIGSGADSWFVDNIQFERIEAGLIEVRDATVCPLDDSYERFKQWKLNVGSGCGGSSIAVITAGIVSFDPAANQGRKVARLVGALRPVNIGSFNVWIMNPRDDADLTLAP